MLQQVQIRKILITVILAIFLFGSLMYYAHRALKRNYSDFHVNYIAGKRMLQRSNLYDFWKSGLANFKYPPFFAFLMMPLAVFDEFWAAILWHIINFMLLVLCFKTVRGILNGSITNRQAVFLYIFTIFFSLRVILQNLNEGQVNILMMSALIFCFYFLIRGKDLIASAFFAFSMLIKYMPAILLPYFIFRRRFKFLIATCIFVVILSFLPALFIGWSYNLTLLKQFIPFVFSSSTDTGSISTNPNQSLLALLMRFLSSEAESNINFLSLDTKVIIFIFFILFVIFYLLIILNKRAVSEKSQVIDYALLLICIALFNPNAWKHAFIFLIFGYMILLYYLIKVNFRDKIILGFVILSLILGSFTPESPMLPKDFFEIYSTITLGALLVFISLIKIKYFTIPWQEKDKLT